MYCLTKCGLTSKLCVCTCVCLILTKILLILKTNKNDTDDKPDMCLMTQICVCLSQKAVSDLESYVSCYGRKKVKRKTMEMKEGGQKRRNSLPLS